MNIKVGKGNKVSNEKRFVPPIKRNDKDKVEIEDFPDYDLVNIVFGKEDEIPLEYIQEGSDVL